MKVKSISRVRLLATSWTAAYQAPRSMGFARQEYWSGLPLPSPCNAVSGSIPGLGKSPEEGKGYPLHYSWASLDGKESACNEGDLSSIPGLGRSPGEGNGNPFQYSCLGNSMDRGTQQGLWGHKRVGHDSATKHGEGDGTPLQYSCLEYPMDRGTW